MNNAFDNIIKNTFDLTNVEVAVRTIEAAAKQTSYRLNEQQQTLLKLVGVAGILQSRKYNYYDQKKVAEYLRKIADDLDPEVIQ